MRGVAGVALVISVLALLPGTAFAKGARDATISGPGLREPLHVDSAQEGQSLHHLADSTGMYYAAFPATPSPIEPRPPRGRLGPRYRVVYELYTDMDTVTPVRQDVYPFARAGFVTYTPAGQRIFDKGVRSGWYTSAVQAVPIGGGMPSETATDAFVALGVPDRRISSSPHER